MKNEIQSNLEQKNIEQESIKDIKVEASIQITEAVKVLQSLYERLNDGGAEIKSEGLSDEEKKEIKEETGWSEEIINHIENMEQYEIYKKAGLHETEIDGRKCLIKDIDMDYVDPKTGMTNRELLEKGRSPIDSKTGEKIELHHMGQDYDSPFAELCENSEHGDGNHSVLHTKYEDSWRNNPELKNQYNNVDKPNHWKERAKEV